MSTESSAGHRCSRDGKANATARCCANKCIDCLPRRSGRRRDAGSDSRSMGQLRTAIVGDCNLILPGSTLTSCRFRASFFPSPSIRYRPTLSISGGNPDIFATSDAFEPAHHELTCMSRMFTVLSQSWTMVQEIAAVYNKGDDAPLFERVKSSLAKAKYQQLLAWADDLSPWPSNNLSSAAHVSILKYRPP